MAKYEYTDDMIARIQEVAANGVTEEVIEQLVSEFEFPRRSVTAKMRKMNYDVPAKAGKPPVFDDAETAALKSFLVDNSGEFTAEQIAESFADGKFDARQINGKALSLEMTEHVKPAEKKVTPKTYTEAEEAKIREMVEANAFIEDIADALGKTVPSVRGKLLSMSLTAVQRDKKSAKSDPYDGIEDMLDKTVEELAEHFDKTPRGVKTMLTRRKLVCKDYTPPALRD